MRQILLVAGILGGGIPVFAQTTPSTPATQPAFTESIVVSATLAPEKVADLPASVTVLDEQEIAARQAQSLPELLATVPGLTVTQTGSPGQQTSLFTRGSESDQTLLLWNGIELNDPYFGAVNWQFIPTEGVERVEIVRGPFSALYGSNALGGVVQVISSAKNGGTLNLEGGEAAYRRASLAAGFDLAGAHVDVAGHSRRGDGFFANDRFDSDEGVVRALWNLTAGTSLGVVVRADESQTGIPTDGFSLTPSAEIAWRETELAVPLHSQLGRWGIDGQLSRTRLNNSFHDPDNAFGFVASSTESEARRGRAVATVHVDDALWFAFGGDAERLEVSDSSNFGVNLDDADQRTWALFTQAGWAKGPLHLEAGVRRDDNNVYGGATNLRLGGVVALGGGARLRASYGEAFRAPSLGDLFYPGTGNPDLRPERGRSYEVGIERESGGLRLGLTGFENRQRDLIDFDPATFVSFNVGRARSRGIEAEVGYRRGIAQARLNGTWLDAEDLTTSLALRRRPKRSGNLVLGLSPGAWTLSLAERYVGERPDFDPTTGGRGENPGYLRSDVAVRWRATSRFSPYARLDNAFDRHYQEALGYDAPGRTWIAGVGVGF